MGQPLKDDLEFQLTPLSEEEVVSRGIAAGDLYFLKVGETSQGPYALDDLKKFLEITPDFPRKTLTKRGNEEEWKFLYEHSPFQRRKPQLVPSSDLICGDDFYILKEGHKHGPYNIDEIKGMVKEKELLLNQQISVNKGEDWIKVYQHPEFDRRSREINESLPYRPDEGTFVGSKADLLAKLKEENSESSSEQLIELANLKLERKAQKFSNSIQPNRREEIEEKQNKIRLVSLLVGFLFIFSGAILITFGPSNEVQKKVSKFKSNSPKLKPIETFDAKEKSKTERAPAAVKKAAAPTRVYKAKEPSVEPIDEIKPARRVVKKRKALVRPLEDDEEPIDELETFESDDPSELDDLPFEQDPILKRVDSDILEADEELLGEQEDLDTLDAPQGNPEDELFDNEVAF